MRAQRIARIDERQHEHHREFRCLGTQPVLIGPVENRSGWLIHIGIGLRAGSADRATLVLIIVPERPRTLDRFFLVLGAGDLPIAAALAQVGEIVPAVLAMRTPHALPEPPPSLLDRDLVDIADFDLALVVDGTA